MSYKTILVHADAGAAAGARIRLAARLALTYNAHLIGSAPTGISRFIPPRVLAAAGPALAAACATLRGDADTALQCFARIAAEEGVASFEPRLVDDDVDGGMALQARYCDLVVVGQYDRDAPASVQPVDLPDYVLLNGARPVLVVPAAACDLDLQGQAIVAWNGSLEATRAVTGALPLLRAARHVTVLAFDAERSYPRAIDDPGAGLAGYLRRHGIAADAVHHRATHDAGTAILAAAHAAGAGMVVMGGYGRSRLRETLLDGPTAKVLRALALPVLLAH